MNFNGAALQQVQAQDEAKEDLGKEEQEDQASSYKSSGRISS
jgi:hypothetical protein